MRIAISNIAWDVSEDSKVAELLKRYNIDAIDIAPGKYFSDFNTVSIEEVLKVKEWWSDHGIEITGMQSLLFGTNGLNLFADNTIQEKMLNHLSGVCRVASILESPRLVFGSPRNRDRGTLEDDRANEIAYNFFNKLGSIAQKHNVIICLEPNPVCYGANFMTTAEETALIVKLINNPSIRMQFDTGAMTINKETPDNFLNRHYQLIGHIHASEPNLITLGEGTTDHKSMGDSLKKFLPYEIVTIEMVTDRNRDHVDAISDAIKVAQEWYL